MKNILVSALVLVLISVNNYLGRVDGSISIGFTPILIGLSVVLILFFTDYPLSLKYIIMTLVIISNDILIKLFAGGARDAEGQGWITAYFLIGLLVALPFVLIFTLQLKEKRFHSFIYLIISGLFLTAYLLYFGTLGIIDIDPPINERAIAKAKGLYISKVKCSENYFVVEKDTFYIKNGWLQAQTRMNHQGLLKKTERTENNYCLFEINGKFDKYEINRNVYYKVNDTSSSGSRPIQNTISFPVNKNSKKFEMTLFNAKDKFKAFRKVIIIPANY